MVQQTEISQIGDKQDTAFDAVDSARPTKTIAHDQQHQGQRTHYRKVAIKNLSPQDRGGNQSRHRHYCQQVEHIRAKYIANGDVMLALQRANDGGGQFRQAGADGDNGQSDDEITYPKPFGNIDCAPHQHARAE